VCQAGVSIASCRFKGWSPELDWDRAGFHPKDLASAVGMLDLDAQEDDVSGAAQDRTAEFAAPKFIRPGPEAARPQAKAFRREGAVRADA